MRTKKFISVLLTLVMIFGLVPTTSLHVHAWDDYVECEYCGAGCGDDYICSGGSHCSEDSGRSCYEEHHCADCGELLAEGEVKVTICILAALRQNSRTNNICIKLQA